MEVGDRLRSDESAIIGGFETGTGDPAAEGPVEQGVFQRLADGFQRLDADGFLEGEGVFVAVIPADGMFFGFGKDVGGLHRFIRCLGHGP